ncbi:hypothetical protein M407DRAFT_146893 [Tulasnella calospora MUT 4182]|uniref:Ricin B lectin domain-containing protein n=1 Tax=Tulasnella calospora MUT 4182 TaxID=1051891 RepID=A0A0C3Q7M6_9AGAM|nr:hypothetical protein M407DRAFT_146893 [Tulasnella calospora MUT 4182]
MQLSVSLLALFAAAVSSVAVPRASSKCHTVHTGYMATFPGENPTKYVAVGLNKKKQVTYGAGDPLFKVEFQTCPKLPEQAPDIDWYKGRIIVSGSNNCVTVTNPNGSEPFFLEVKKCGDNVIPPASQQWEWGNDFGDVVFWRGKSKEDEIGYTIDDKSNPVTESGTHRIELGCSNSCSSFAIKPKSQLG